MKSPVLICVLFLLGCSTGGSYLKNIKRSINSDIKHQTILEYTWVYKSGKYNPLPTDQYKTELIEYSYDRKFIDLDDNKQKWIFINKELEGCIIEYIVYYDKDGDKRTLNAYISSDEEKCEQRIYTNQPFG